MSKASVAPVPVASKDSGLSIKTAGRAVVPYAPAITVFIAAIVWGTLASPFFLNVPVLLLHTGRYVEIGLLALAMTLVIIHGDIDLSVASNMAFSAAVLGLVYQSTESLVTASIAALITGTLLGLFNGVLVAVVGLPSLVVTLGTLALYRGMAQIALGDQAVTGYPSDFVGADQITFFGILPFPLLIFFIAAILFGILLHRTRFGFTSFLLGKNQRATLFTGLSPKFNRLVAFALAGSMAGLAAILITARLGSTRSNLGFGFELLVITIVVLGGTDIFGGRGNIMGTVVALFAVIAVREAMTIQNINGQIQDAMIGLLLVFIIALPPAISRLQRARDQLSRRRSRVDFTKGKTQ